MTVPLTTVLSQVSIKCVTKITLRPHFLNPFWVKGAVAAKDIKQALNHRDFHCAGMDFTAFWFLPALVCLLTCREAAPAAKLRKTPRQSDPAWFPWRLFQSLRGRQPLSWKANIMAVLFVFQSGSATPPIDNDNLWEALRKHESWLILRAATVTWLQKCLKVNNNVS